MLFRTGFSVAKNWYLTLQSSVSFSKSTKLFSNVISSFPGFGHFNVFEPYVSCESSFLLYFQNVLLSTYFNCEVFNFFIIFFTFKFLYIAYIHYIQMINSFFTLKDHNDNFANPQVRSSNPGQNEFRKIGKARLDEINLSKREYSSLSQWKICRKSLTGSRKYLLKSFKKFLYLVY